MTFPFLKEEKIGDRTQMTFIGNKCEIYIPTYFFDKGNKKAIAMDLGDRIKVVGLLYLVVDGESYLIKMPTYFEFQFSEMEKRKLKLTKDIPDEEYTVYILKKGDALQYDVLHVINFEDFELFFNKLISGGKMPPYMNYGDILEIFLNAMDTNGVAGLDVGAVLLEMFLSELYRNKNNMNEPFRLTANEKNGFNGRMINIKKVPQFNSTFTGLTGEDTTMQIVAAIARNRDPNKSKERESPVEKMIKY